MYLLAVDLREIGNGNSERETYVSNTNRLRGSSDDKANDSNGLRSSDVPSPLIEPPRQPRHEDRACSGNEIWWASEDESDSAAKIKSLDDSGELCRSKLALWSGGGNSTRDSRSS